MDPYVLSKKVLHAVAQGRPEVILCTSITVRVAIWLRNIVPWLIFYVFRRRAVGGQGSEK